MVSVILPNFNHELYLKQRIDSILNQTYEDFELIILDDCSTDKSRDIIEQYRNHSKVSEIDFNVINSGSTFKQWNKGVALSKGEIIWIAESDDLADPEFLNTLVQIMDQEPRVGIAYTNSYVIDAQNQVLTTYQEEYASWSDRWQHNFINNGQDEVVRYLRFAAVILNASSCIFRKALFENTDKLKEDYRLSGDWLTYVQILQQADIAYIARPLNYFRTHTHTVRSSSKQFVHFLETIKVISYIYNHFKVPASEKKAQAYNLLAQFRQLSPQLTTSQKATIMNYFRRHFMWHIDLLRWKYEISLLVKKLF